MFYLCKLESYNNQIRHTAIYFSEKINDIICYISDMIGYDNFIEHQNLNNNDLYIYSYYNYDNQSIEHVPMIRDLQVVDIENHHKKIIDMRLFTKEFTSYEYQNQDKTNFERKLPYLFTDNKAQGKTHYKSYNYHYCFGYKSRQHIDKIEEELIYEEMENMNLPNIPKSIRAKRKNKYWYRYMKENISENNWKSKKIKKQYMVHKRQHKDTYNLPCKYSHLEVESEEILD